MGKLLTLLTLLALGWVFIPHDFLSNYGTVVWALKWHLAIMASVVAVALLVERRVESR